MQLRTAVKSKSFKYFIKTLYYIILISFTLVLLYPMIFMLLAGSFSRLEYYYQITHGSMGLIPIPTKPTFKNYLALFSIGGEFPKMWVYFKNSLVRTVYTAIMTVATTLICAYVFARLKFRGKRQILLILLLTTMIPETITLIPTYLMYAYFPFTGGKGILDTWAIYLIGGPCINIMATFITKQYFDSIPASLDESAKIDGANVFRIIFSILAPIAKPIIAYVAITTSIGIWNDWQTAFFFTSSDNLRLLPTAISDISINASSGMTIPDYPLMITLGLAVTIPALVIYLIFQKYIVEGLAHVGIKG